MRALLVSVLVLSLTVPVSAAAQDSVPYAQVKRAVAALRATQRPAVDGHSGPYEIRCNPFYDFTGAVYGDHAEDDVETYADVAARVLGLEEDLPLIGYPRHVWSAWLSRYESRTTAAHTLTPAPSAVFSHEIGLGDLGKSPGNRYAHAQLSGFEGLRDLLASYRRSHSGARPVVVGPCIYGSGERGLTLLTRPSATHVFIIPTFFYELCRVRNVDPEDTSRCEHWREVLSLVVPVSGSYHYVAKWRDGTTARGILDEEAVTSGTITLRKP